MGSGHSLQTFPFGLFFEAGLSLEEQGGHLQIEVREKASVRDGLQDPGKAAVIGKREEQILSSSFPFHTHCSLIPLEHFPQW